MDLNMNLNFNEALKLVHKLFVAQCNYKIERWSDGCKICLLNQDYELLDDAVITSFTHGWEDGLLETFYLNECAGYETADEVFNGWKEKYNLGFDGTEDL